MMVISLIVFVVLILFGYGSICPMSSVMDLNNSQSYFYPVDIYAPKEVFHQILRQKKVFPCYGALSQNPRNLHNCSSTVRFCPVKHQNILAAMRRSSGSHSLCHLKRKFSDTSEKLRVFVLGGSVTAGSHSQGCNVFDAMENLLLHSRCSWVYHFGEWIKNTSAANVTYFNFGWSGLNSGSSAYYLDILMRTYRTQQFRATDLILLDHAVNDAHERPSNAARGLESLIRRIYSLSVNDTWPSIVLLDSLPSRTDQYGFDTYPTLYTNLSRYYDIPVWSYRDAITSRYATSRQSQYIAYLNFSNNGGDIHPPWHVHLFMADLYAAVLLKEWSECSESDMAAADRLHHTPLLLPPALHIDSLSMECRLDVSDLLRFNYADIKAGSTVGSYNLSSGGWHLSEDKGGRGGFMIDRATSHYTASKALKQVNDVLSFRLSNTTESLLHMQWVYVQVMHLKTYQNAGTVDVRLCGQLDDPLDALWEDHRTNRISIPQWAQYQFNLQECVVNNFTYPTVEFLYNGLSSGYTAVRGQHHFKIVSIKVCAEN